MPASSPPLNPWLVIYISQYQNRQSRYDIDLYLLETGFDPTEIDAVWQYYLNPKHQSGKVLNYLIGLRTNFFLATRYRSVPKIKQKHNRGKQAKFWAIMILLIILGLTGLYYLAVVMPSQVPKPLPAYPNSHLFQADESFVFKLFYSDCSGNHFAIQNYQIYNTFDSVQQVKSFYEQKTIVRYTTRIGEIDYFDYHEKFICYSEIMTLGITNGINVVALLDPNKFQDAMILNKVFPQAPKNEVMIIVVQGLSQKI